MMNEPSSRTERIAAGLERHFGQCDARLRDCNSNIETIVEEGRYFTPWDVDCMIKFMNAGVQIAGMIARLETLAARNSKNSGSNPQ